jgi:hypothetical protein
MKRAGMKPLNLSAAPPRGPREAIDGLMFLPRSIDKVRATLPGGDPGDYRIVGVTQAMLEHLEIPLDAFTRAVADAEDDAAVAAFVRARVPADAYDRWNARLLRWEPRGGNRAEAIGFYPWLAQRPDLIYVLDVLEEDDKQAFAARR